MDTISDYYILFFEGVLYRCLLSLGVCDWLDPRGFAKTRKINNQTNNYNNECIFRSSIEAWQGVYC